MQVSRLFIKFMTELSFAQRGLADIIIWTFFTFFCIYGEAQSSLVKFAPTNPDNLRTDG